MNAFLDSLVRGAGAQLASQLLTMPTWEVLKLQAWGSYIWLTSRGTAREVSVFKSEEDTFKKMVTWVSARPETKEWGNKTNVDEPLPAPGWPCQYNICGNTLYVATVMALNPSGVSEVNSLIFLMYEHHPGDLDKLIDSIKTGKPLESCLGDCSNGEVQVAMIRTPSGGTLRLTLTLEPRHSPMHYHSTPTLSVQ